MWGTGYALRKATVMRTRILSVTPPNPLGVTAPLINKGSQENCVNAMPCRGYNPSVKPSKAERLDSSPYTGEPRSELSSPCRAQGAEVRARCAFVRIQHSDFRIPHYSVAQPHQNVRARRAHLNICPKGANISHARSAYFTAPKARFHTAATLPYFTAALCAALRRHTL